MPRGKCIGCGGTIWSTDSRRHEGICDPCADDIERWREIDGANEEDEEFRED